MSFVGAWFVSLFSSSSSHLSDLLCFTRHRCCHYRYLRLAPSRIQHTNNVSLENSVFWDVGSGSLEGEALHPGWVRPSAGRAGHAKRRADHLHGYSTRETGTILYHTVQCMILFDCAMTHYHAAQGGLLLAALTNQSIHIILSLLLSVSLTAPVDVTVKSLVVFLFVVIFIFVTM